MEHGAFQSWLEGLVRAGEMLYQHCVNWPEPANAKARRDWERATASRFTKDLRGMVRELAAWRGLAEWEGEPGQYRSVVFETAVGVFSGTDGEGRYMIDATDHAPIIRDTPQACAIALAEKLNLIPKVE